MFKPKTWSKLNDFKAQYLMYPTEHAVTHSGYTSPLFGSKKKR